MIQFVSEVRDYASGNSTIKKDRSPLILFRCRPRFAPFANRRQGAPGSVHDFHEVSGTDHNRETPSIGSVLTGFDSCPGPGFSGCRECARSFEKS
jgi:hypothetical protein